MPTCIKKHDLYEMFLQRTFQSPPRSFILENLAIPNLLRSPPRNNRPIRVFPPANHHIHITLTSQYMSLIPPFHLRVRQSHLQQHLH